jgi:Protein of unknown function (DUF1168)
VDLVKTEKIVNPYGSVAGANSGDFHLYRHARSREMERMKNLEESDREKSLDEQYHATLDQYAQEANERTAKRRQKRERAKAAKLRKTCLAQVGVVTGDKFRDNGDESEEEFVYDPTQDHAVLEKAEKASEATKQHTPADEVANESVDSSSEKMCPDQGEKGSDSLEHNSELVANSDETSERPAENR